MEDEQLNQNQLEQLLEGSSNRVFITKEDVTHPLTSCRDDRMNTNEQTRLKARIRVIEQP